MIIVKFFKSALKEEVKHDICETAEFKIDVSIICWDSFLSVEFIKSLVLISYLQSRQKTLNVLFFIFLLAFYC